MATGSIFEWLLEERSKGSIFGATLYFRGRLSEARTMDSRRSKSKESA
jgi:hypothetical protein